MRATDRYDFDPLRMPAEDPRHPLHDYDRALRRCERLRQITPRKRAWLLADRAALLRRKELRQW